MVAAVRLHPSDMPVGHKLEFYCFGSIHTSKWLQSHERDVIVGHGLFSGGVIMNTPSERHLPYGVL